MLLILPTNQFFYLFVPLSFIFLYDSKKTLHLSLFYVICITVLLMNISFLVNINEYYLSLKDISRALALIILFVTFGRLKGNVILASYIVVAIGFIVASQLLYAFNIPFVNSIINNYYLPSEDLQKIYEFSMSSFGQIRLGGIYGNSNNYAEYLELVLVVLIVERKQFQKKYMYILFGLITYSIIATGSRTSLIVLIAIILHFIYINYRKSFTGLLLSFAILFTITLLISQFVDFLSLRAFRINEGVDDSLGIKFDLLIKYLIQDLPLSKILFGGFSGSAMLKYVNTTFPGTDFEIGNLIVYFGFTFFIIILLFYISIYKKYLPRYRFVFIILLWMFSNSILLSYRMSAVWMLVLGLYYYRSKTEKNLVNEK